MPKDFEFDRPYPALTPAQRYHLDVFGYVIVPGVLTPDECGILREALQKLKRDLLAADPNGKAKIRGAWFANFQPHHHYMGGILQADTTITAYATHPRLVSMAEELIGGEARLVEFNAHINRRNPAEDLSKPPQYGFHTGTDIAFAAHSANGLYHCNFVKTLTALTDIGPDDGGTVVVAGSHKVDAPRGDIIKLAYDDPALIHQMTGKAGSTLLFSETLIHATGRIKSDKERVIIIGGYGARMFPWWDSGEMTDEFKQQIPENLNHLLHGRANWTRGPRYRKLDQPADTRPFPLGVWNQR